jgi:hypothetical protein
MVIETTRGLAAAATLGADGTLYLVSRHHADAICGSDSGANFGGSAGESRVFKGDHALNKFSKLTWCAVQRHGLSAGANPVRHLSLQPVAIGAVVEVTKRLKPSV